MRQTPPCQSSNNHTTGESVPRIRKKIPLVLASSTRCSARKRTVAIVVNKCTRRAPIGPWTTVRDSLPSTRPTFRESRTSYQVIEETPKHQSPTAPTLPSLPSDDHTILFNSESVPQAVWI